MENILKQLEKTRKLRLRLLGATLLLFCLILLLSYLLVSSVWLNTIIVFDNIIFLVIIITIIELKLGYKYYQMYYCQFMPLLIKKIGKSYEFQKCANDSSINLLKARIFNCTSNLFVNNVLRYKKDGIQYELYDLSIYLNSYHMRKIIQFKGYLFTFLHPSNDLKDVLILFKKRPYLSLFKVVKRLGVFKYKLYHTSPPTKACKIDAITDVLKKQLKTKNKFQIILNHQVMIFKRYHRSFYRKPFFKSINQQFILNKINEFKPIHAFMEDFIQCFTENNNS